MSTILALNIATIRKRLRMSQTEFSALIGATRTQVSNWERGRSAPPARLLLRMAEVSGIDAKQMNVQELPRGSTAAPAGQDAILVEIQRIREHLDALERLVRQQSVLPVD